jgi:hypothetical protein
MANTFRIKRRITGAPGAPTTLLNAELSYNEVDDILYYGKGLASGVTAAAVIAIGGAGILANYMSLAGAQTVTGNKTFNGNLLAPTVSGSDNSTNVSTTAWVRGYAQPLNSNLTNIAAVATFGFVSQTAAGAYTTRSFTGTAGRIGVTNGDGVIGNPTVDLLTSGVSAGTFTKITVDVYGRATVGAMLSSADIISALTWTPENITNKGAANGYASLDSGGKVPVAQLPASVSGGMNYQGVWNASTNSPALVNGTGTKGYYYKVSTAGNTVIDGNGNWTVGDMVAFNGTTWDKIEGGAPDVVSVAGRIGAVVLSNTDISGLGTLATQNASAVNITGGTVAGATVSGNITGNSANVTGIVTVPNGGSGVATLAAGYVKSSGASPFSSVSTIPSTDISGLGTMATQSAGAVNITGGTIDGVTLDGGTF